MSSLFLKGNPVITDLALNGRSDGVRVLTALALFALESPVFLAVQDAELQLQNNNVRN